MQDSAQIAAMLLADGYCIVEDILLPDVVAGLETDLAPRFETTPFGKAGSMANAPSVSVHC